MNELFTVMSIFAVLVILAVVIVFVVFMNSKNKMIQKHLQSQLEVERNQHQLELQALRSQMNPHFVHNSLNAIQYYIQRNEVELSEIYLTKFSKLIRSFFELSRKQSITIAQEINLLDNYLSIEKLRFEEKLEFTISKDPALDDETLIPAMLLQPIVENAINHGIFHKEGLGKVEVFFSNINETSFKVIIQDNGIGLTQSKAIFEKSGKKLKNRSTAVLEDRLALLEYSKTWKVHYSLSDRTDIQGAIAILIFEPIEDESTSILN